MLNTKRYIGRFAPSPSGPLHLGSLVTALGSYLRAKQQQGVWRLRIDDIDPPRIMAGAIENIQETLLNHGLQWDHNVVFQSQNTLYYEQLLGHLRNINLVYPCYCTRAQVKQKGPYYSGTCRHARFRDESHSLRFINHSHITQLEDMRLGKVAVDSNATGEDFIVKRKDNLYAYHLASVADDIDMQVTEIVRGEDLLIPTACQWALFDALQAPRPACLHLPLVRFDDGRKYSKQNYAPGLDNSNPRANLIDALRVLNLSPPRIIVTGSIEQIIDWAVENWQLSA